MPRQRTSGLDFEALHRLHMQNYERLITKAYDRAIYEAVAIAITLPKGKPSEELFSFDKHPASKKRVEAMMSGLQGRMQGIIEQGMRAEWTLANNKTDALVKRVFGKKLNDEAKHRLLSNNEDAREAFIQRKEKGLGLSDRVWRYTEQFKSEIEMGLDIGIRGGKSADELSRSLRGFLREPNKLFRRVRDEHGQLKLSARAKAYHPGQGVYRSSYKNALRLAVTETNIAYRTADHERQKALDFVVGIEVHLSGNHTLNGKPFKCMCDDLVGKYPKDFKFTGWHPHCRCYTTPILKTPEEMARDTQKLLRGEPVDGHSVNEVKDLPKGFKAWVAQYKDKLKTAVSVPYFLQDNPQYIGEAEYPDWYILKQKAELKEQRKKTLAWGKQALIGKKIVRPEFDQPITFTVCGLKEAINQPHKNYKVKNEALRHIDLLIQQGEYVGSAGDLKGRPFTYHYLKIKIRGIDSFIVLREEKGSLIFYSLVERRKDDSQENSLGYTVRASSESHLSHHKDKQKSLFERSKARHEARTAEQISDIQSRWDDRNASNLVEKALKVKEEVQQYAELVAQAFDASLTPINLKSKASIVRKLNTYDVNHSVFKVKDAVRTTIIAPATQIDALRNHFRTQIGGTVLRVKEQSGAGLLGYTGTIVNIRCSNGIVGEVQINTPRMIYAKEKPEDAMRILGRELWEKIRRETGMDGGLGHKYYEEFRLLSEEEQRSEKGEALRKASEAYYDRFRG